MKQFRSQHYDEDTIIEILESFGISYKLEGKNVSDKAVGVCCPFCDDRGFHLGVFKETGGFSCWRCGTTGSLSYLIRQVTGVGYSRIREVVGEVKVVGAVEREHRGGVAALKEIYSRTNGKTKVKKKKKPVAISFPVFCDDVENQAGSNRLFDSFLAQRGFSIEDLSRFKVQVCTAGKFAYRIIVPVFEGGEMVAYVARDMSGRATIKALNPSGISINQFLYIMSDFFEEAPTRRILVEGVFDAWRVGLEGIATFGTHITDEQREKIFALRPSEVVFAWDADAYDKSKKEAFSKFAPYIRTKAVRLPAGEDPDSLGHEALCTLIENTPAL